MNINRLQKAKNKSSVKAGKHSSEYPQNTQVDTRRNQVLTKAFCFISQHYLYLSILLDSNNSL